MPKTYYDSELTGAQIEAALEAIHGVVTPSNNGKVLYIENGQIKAASASRWSGGAVLEPLSVTANGDYTPPSGTDGFDEVHVAVPSATLTTKSITQNGTYNASSDNADGYSSVTVNVSGGGSAVIQPLSVTQNGTYNPPSGVDGYAPVTVNVSGGGGGGDPALPAEYQRVEYVVFSGTQWFSVPADFSDTSIKPTIYTKSAITADTPASENAVVGSGPGTSTIPEIFYNSSKALNAGQATSNYNYIIISRDSAGALKIASSSNLTVVAEQVSETLTIYGNKSIDHINVGCYRDTNNYPFTGKIFRVWFGSDDGAADGNYLKFDYFTKLFDLIPCYRKADGEIGFYDIVGNAFYTNQGTGTFGKGPDVN